MKKKIICMAMAWAIGACLIGSGSFPEILPHISKENFKNVYAGKSMESEIQDANKEKQSLEQEKKQLESEIAAIEAKKDNVVDYIQIMDEKLTNLSEKIERNQEERSKVKARIRILRKEEKKAKADKKKQYDTMSRRIKYIYENGNTGYLEILFGADSLSDLFNRAEYVSKVTGYDRQMFKNYQKVCEKLVKSKKQLNEKLTRLAELRDSLQLEQNSVNTLVEKKTAELSRYQLLADDKTSQLNRNHSLLKQQEESLEQLMEEQRKQAEDAEKKKQAAQKNKSQSTTDSSKNTHNSGTNNNITRHTVTVGGYGWPLSVSGRITSYFGYRNAPTAGASSYHKGIDISVPSGSSVLATKSGTVVTSTYSSSAGNYIAISHGNGVYSYYMHCSKRLVGVGTKVSKGQKIALSGNTGISTGPHLHFAIYANGSYADPLNYVSR